MFLHDLHLNWIQAWGSWISSSSWYLPISNLRFLRFLLSCNISIECNLPQTTVWTCRDSTPAFRTVSFLAEESTSVCFSKYVLFELRCHPLFWSLLFFGQRYFFVAPSIIKIIWINEGKQYEKLNNLLQQKSRHCFWVRQA